jgi:hypothetical protein
MYFRITYEKKYIIMYFTNIISDLWSNLYTWKIKMTRKCKCHMLYLYYRNATGNPEGQWSMDKSDTEDTMDTREKQRQTKQNSKLRKL